jgi:glycosyltransferase involved in cell wall biosynthesis
MPMKVLFLPNFKVFKLSKEDPVILSSNQYLDSGCYWFFKYMPGVKVTIIDNSKMFPFSLLEKIVKFELFQPFKALLCQKKYDVIISHSYNSGFVFSLLRSLFNINYPPHILIDIGCLNGGKDNKFQIKIIKFALKSISGVIYHSTVNKKFYSEHFSSLNSTFIPFGVDPEYFSPLDDIPRNDYALSIGYAKRDYGTLLTAWKDIDFPLKIIGVNKSTITDLNISNVEFVPKVTINVLKEYIHHAKFVVLPILNEKYSVGQMTFLQSMAMKKPVIIGLVPGILDYIDNNCLTYKYGNVEDLTEKIKIILSDTDLAICVSDNARSSIIDKYNERDMAQSIFKYLIYRHTGDQL